MESLFQNLVLDAEDPLLSLAMVANIGRLIVLKAKYVRGAIALCLGTTPVVSALFRDPRVSLSPDLVSDWLIQESRWKSHYGSNTGVPLDFGISPLEVFCQSGNPSRS